MFSINFIQAQDLTIGEYASVIDGSPDSDDIYVYVDIINTSNVEQSLLWERFLRTPPSSWQTWICDENNCYLPNIDRCAESKPNILQPGDTLQFQIHVKPNGEPGVMDIDVNIFPLNDQTNILGVISTTFNVQTTSSKELTKAEIKVYPNPTTDYFQISDPKVSSVTVFNIVGNKMRTFDAIPDRYYDVGDLKEGLYLVRMMDKSNKVIKTVRLSKR
jgi:hypothetical protein